MTHLCIPKCVDCRQEIIDWFAAADYESLSALSVLDVARMFNVHDENTMCLIEARFDDAAISHSLRIE